MAIRDYVSNLVRAAMNKPIVPIVTNSPSNILGSTTIFNFGNAEVYAHITVTNAIKLGFNSNTAVNAIVMACASKFGSIPRYLFDATVKEEKSFHGIERKARPSYKPIEEDNELTQLLNRPNPNESQDAFFTKVFAFLKVCGEAFVWLNRDGADGLDLYEDTSKLKVLEMHVLPPDRVILKPDPLDVFSPLYYILDGGGIRRPIRKTDMIHWKLTTLNWDANTLEHLRGFPPLAAGSKTLEENNAMSLAAMRQAQNDGARGALVNKTIGQRPTPTAESEIRNAINSKINNANTSGQVAALNGDWDYLDLGKSAVDLELREAKADTWKELCALFQYPYELIDPGTTFANKLQAQKGWVSNMIMPACKQFDGELNRVLLKAFGMEKTVFIGSDYSDLPEMQIDLAAMATALAAAWWYSPNEKREQMGEEELEGDEFDELWPPPGLGPMSEQQANAEMDRELMRQGMADNGSASSSDKPPPK